MYRMSRIDLSRLASQAAASLAQLPRDHGAWEPDSTYGRNLEILIERLSNGDAVSTQFGTLLRDALARPHELASILAETGLLLTTISPANYSSWPGRN
ncbi:hypothetical protein [Paraburkholderia sp. BR14320]